MQTLEINNDQLQKMKSQPGFVAALERSGAYRSGVFRSQWGSRIEQRLSLNFGFRRARVASDSHADCSIQGDNPAAPLRLLSITLARERSEQGKTIEVVPYWFAVL